LLEYNKRLNEVNRGVPEATKMIYDFVVGKHAAELAVMWSQMKVNSSHLYTELKKADIEKNNI
jgi:malate/lactate dehydrogenase